MKKKFWLGVLAYLVPTFIIGYFWHLSWFHPLYENLHMYRADVIIPFGLLSMVLQGLIFSWSYPKLFDTSQAEWMKSALRAFLVFGILSWSFTTLAVAAKNAMSSVPDYLLLESAFTAVQFLLVAPLIAWVWRKTN